MNTLKGILAGSGAGMFLFLPFLLFSGLDFKTAFFYAWLLSISSSIAGSIGYSVYYKRW